MRRLPPDHLEEGPGSQLERLPQVRRALPHRRRRPAEAAAGRWRIRAVRCGPRAPPTRSASWTASPTASACAAMQEATDLTDALISAAGKLDGRTVQICAMEPRFIGGSMGCGGGREDRARHRARHRAQHAADHRLRFRRRAHAGGRRQPDADGQDFGGADAPGRSAPALHQRAHRPHHRRRHRQLRHAGRSEHRRTGRADRLRRPARDRADHPPEAARGLPAQRVSAEARHAGRRGAAPGAEAVHRQGADVLLRAA